MFTNINELSLSDFPQDLSDAVKKQIDYELNKDTGIPLNSVIRGINEISLILTKAMASNSDESFTSDMISICYHVLDDFSPEESECRWKATEMAYNIVKPESKNDVSNAMEFTLGAVYHTYDGNPDVGVAPFMFVLPKEFSEWYDETYSQVHDADRKSVRSEDKNIYDNPQMCEEYEVHYSFRFALTIDVEKITSLWKSATSALDILIKKYIGARSQSVDGELGDDSPSGTKRLMNRYNKGRRSMTYKSVEVQNKELKALRRTLADGMRSALLAIDEMEDMIYSGDAIQAGIDDSALIKAVEELKSANQYIKSATDCTSKAQDALRQYQIDTTGKAEPASDVPVASTHEPYGASEEGFRRFRQGRKNLSLAQRRKMARARKQMRVYGTTID